MKSRYLSNVSGKAVASAKWSDLVFGGDDAPIDPFWSPEAASLVAQRAAAARRKHGTER